MTLAAGKVHDVIGLIGGSCLGAPTDAAGQGAYQVRHNGTIGQQTSFLQTHRPPMITKFVRRLPKLFDYPSRPTMRSVNGVRWHVETDGTMLELKQARHTQIDNLRVEIARLMAYRDLSAPLRRCLEMATIDLDDAAARLDEGRYPTAEVAIQWQNKVETVKNPFRR